MTRTPFGEEQMNRAVQHLLARPHFHAAILVVAMIFCGVLIYPIAWTIKSREANSEHGISK